VVRVLVTQGDTPPKRAMKFEATSASAADISEVEDIKPLSTTFVKIVNDSAHARREEKERGREATMHRDRFATDADTRQCQGQHHDSQHHERYGVRAQQGTRKAQARDF
jgi:hypothetical protein